MYSRKNHSENEQTYKHTDMIQIPAASKQKVIHKDPRPVIIFNSAAKQAAAAEESATPAKNQNLYKYYINVSLLLIL